MTVPLRVRALFVAFALVMCAVSAAVAQTATEQVLFSFPNASDSTGFRPLGPLMQGNDGNLYGAVGQPGTAQAGQIFKLTTSGAITMLPSYTGGLSVIPQNPVIQGGNGNLYGASPISTNVAPFSMTQQGAVTALCNNLPAGFGIIPTSGAMVEGSDGNFYGTFAFANNPPYTGGVFQLTPSCANVIYDFDDGTGSNPAGPNGNLVEGSDGNYYGTEGSGGGANGVGSVYKITTSGTETTLYSFTGADDGSSPNPGLIEYSDGTYYGTTYFGGAKSDGTVFKISPVSPYTLTTLYTFTGTTDGANPTALWLASDGNFYGTSRGGANSLGTFFQITPTGTLKTLYSFAAVPDASSPANISQGSDGNFYGTSAAGGDGPGGLCGSTNCGTVFKVTLSPALAGPVQLSLSNSSVDSGTPVTLSWRVSNAFSLSMQQCYAFVQGGYAAAGTWTGLQAGTLNGDVFSGSAQVTPTDGGVYTYALTCGGVESGFATLTVSGGTLVINPLTLQGDFTGTPYSQTLVAQGGTPPYTWSVSSGSLPPGLTLNASTGTISGTPTTAGAYNFVGKVTDSASSPATATASLSIAITAALAITTTSLPNATVGSAYSASVVATGGTAPYSWTISSGSLPAGLSLNASSGAISGTPTTGGTASFTVKVTDSEIPNVTATANLSIAVSAQTVTITTTSLPQGTVGKAYSQTLAATGGTSPYTWSITSGSLPAGLSLSSAGVISGTPTTAETSSFTVMVTDSASHTATASLSIVVANVLTVATASLGGSVEGTTYSGTLAASGGTSPYAWVVTSGSLPPGLSLTSSTGVISGTSTAVGTFGFTVEVTDSDSRTATANLSITIFATVTVTTTSLPTAQTGVVYSTQLQELGGVAPYTWSIVSGTLPAGLSLAGATGAITGTPTAVRTSNFVVQVTDAYNYTSSASVFIVVTPSTLTVTTTELGTGDQGTQLGMPLTAVGGTAPYTWSVSAGALPKGLVLSTTGGVIGGTPSATGTSSFTVEVEDSAGHTATQALSMVIYASSIVRITTGSLPDGIINTPYSTPLVAASGTKPYTWSIGQGTLPAGLSLDVSTGVISGTPTAPGTETLLVNVKGAGNNVAGTILTLTINGPLGITSVVLPTGTVGVDYSTTLVAAGGIPPYEIEYDGGTLPPGLGGNSEGQLYNKPTEAGTFAFTYLVKDNAGNISKTPLTIIVYGSTIVRVTTASLPAATVGTAYSATLAATSGTKPYTWSVYSGSLPAGLSLNATTGVISGTPVAAGTVNFLVGVKGSGNNVATAGLSIAVAQ